MKLTVLGIHGSPRKKSTHYILNEALRVAGEIEGVETHGVALGDLDIHLCIHCNRCLGAGVFFCPVYQDGMTGLYPLVQQADVILLASPVYNMAPSAQMMAFINRLRPLGKLGSAGGWAAKVGCGIAVGGARNGGEETTLDALNRFFLSTGMCLAGGGVFTYNGASIWSGHGRGEGRTDETGNKTLAIAVRRAVLTARFIKRGLAGETLYTGVALAGFSDEDERQRYLNAFWRG
ncbi:MAG: flavodoxin family protein [Treponema sp.]|jgi:multimeric flavodoxin WrbA|nr:flavodoxin family protein [Treponema sp.]